MLCSDIRIYLDFYEFPDSQIAILDQQIGYRVRITTQIIISKYRSKVLLLSDVHLRSTYTCTPTYAYVRQDMIDVVRTTANGLLERVPMQPLVDKQDETKNSFTYRSPN